MAKQKMENRSFQDRREADYLFVNVKDRPVCLVYGANMAVTKDYNIRRHYEMKHQNKYKDLAMKQKLQKEEEMKRSLVSRQTMFTKAKANFIVVAERAKSARPFNEGEFVKKCMIKLVISCAQIKGKHF